MEPPLPEAASTTGNNLSSSILLIVVVILAVAFFVSVLLHVLIRCLLRTPASSYLDRGEDGDDDDIDIGDTNVTAMQGRLRQLFRLHDSGVDQSFIDELPVFPYGAVVGGLEDPFDCAVCLCGFEPDDKLRLLTACSHAFHVGCIDTWLLAHSTCPLCRSSLLLLDCSAACESSRLSVASSVVSSVVLDDDKLVEEKISEAKEEVVEVRLGKFRNVDGGSGGGGKEMNDERRCYSMGSYEYIMSGSSSLRVAVKPTTKRRQLQPMSECDCNSRRVAQLGFLKLGFEHDSAKKRSSIGGGGGKRESFSVSKIWLRKDQPRPTNGAESSRRAVSFRLPTPSRHELPEAETKSVVVERGGGSETEAEAEADAAGSCCSNSTIVSMESQIGETPSFARRTLQWIVNKNNRVGNHGV